MVKRVMQKLLIRPIRYIGRLEAQLLEREGAVGYVDESPARFEIPLEMLRLDSDRVRLPGFPRTLPLLLGTMRDSVRILRTLDENEGKERTRIDARTLRELEGYARSIGVGSIGYTAVPGKYVFRNKAVSFGNAVVITMEMDKDIMEAAPSKEVGAMVHRTYNSLGKMTIKDRPRELEAGLIKCVDTEKCFRVFAEEHGCSVCIKVCPLNRVGYDRVYETYCR